MAVTVADIQRLAEAKLEESARTYIAIGAGQEQTASENTRAFQRLRFRPRVLTGVETIRTSTSVLGHTIPFPVGLSPSAAQKIANPVGEVGTAQAAQEVGTVMILSCLSTVPLEDVRANAPDCVLWQQVYLFSERCLTESLVKRAAEQGCTAIVVTADAPVDGDKISRHEYPHSLPHGLSTANLDASFSYHRPDCTAVSEHSREVSAMHCATFKEIEWLRTLSELPVVVKGVLAAEDALEAHRHGAAAVLVSNHGGRQLDGTPATIDVLAEIVAAVGDKLEVYLDSGVRTGADVVKALALGARAVFVGRPVLWGLAYDGEQGVQRVLRILRNELEHTMRLLGCSDVNDLCEDFVIDEKRHPRPLRCAL
ncbi:2-Hydroxyacid oxidase 1-like [Dermacentor andersoni]|uniref:2-Hydroxyacid oxidase 1-like n=1 Tax=Dermacentor andersoni TaxID=34620 RepID=UPI003B3BB1FD